MNPTSGVRRLRGLIRNRPSWNSGRGGRPLHGRIETLPNQSRRLRERLDTAPGGAYSTIGGVRQRQSAVSARTIRDAILVFMTVTPARYLVRGKDLADARYAEPLTVADMARAARLSPAHFSREF